MKKPSANFADRLLAGGVLRTFAELTAMPGIGHKRQDLTHRDLLFWRLHSYLIIYRDSQPLRIVRIIHAKRDVTQLLKAR